ncbi:MAG: response regulator, partial [Leptospiraceae bacterium]|nr:response regulator [Leptospiraceae bacterium]
REVAKAGISANLYKPVKPAALYESLAQPVNAPRTASAESATTKWDATMAERRPLRILAAEDNLVNQKVIQTLLGRYGYRVDLAGDGLQAVEAVRRQPYDVVLMDVQMPEMDGVEATLAIRAEMPPERQPYIIAMTANAFDDQRRIYLESGMNDYVSKPVRPAMLVAALDRVPETHVVT